MEIVQDRAVLVKTRKPHLITEVLPDSHVVQQVNLPYGEVGSTVAVKWTLRNTKILHNLGFSKVPCPIGKRYNWPGMFKPFAHQIETAGFLSLNPRCFCLNDMGTGKTMSVIWASDYLMKLGVIKRVLIVAPLSILDTAWRADLFKTAMHRRVDIAHGSAAKRKAIIASDAEYVIINYDGIEIVHKEIMEGGFDLIVCDECFIAGTKVLTPTGSAPIESLKADDEVLTSSGPQRIKTLVRNSSAKLVDVRLSNGQTITCTREHPFFTDIGWVTAEHLEGRTLISNIMLSDVQRNLPSEENLLPLAEGQKQTSWFNLLKILRTEEVQHPKSGDFILPDTTQVSTGDKQRNSPIRRIQTQDVGKPQSSGPQANCSWREWDRNDSDGSISKRSSSRLLDMELPRSVGAEARRLSYELQARFCKANIEDRSGSGWEQPRYGEEKRARPEERSEVSGIRVESVSYTKCDSPITVFNLEVEGSPNYFVGEGYLVHNCTALKNHQTKRWKLMNQLVRPETWLWLMTGTPAAQSPDEAYGLAKLVNPQGVPRFFGSFRDRVMLKVTNFRYVPRPEAQEIVHKALQPAIRFTKEECLDLPEMTYVDREVPLTAQQQKYYDKLRQQLLIEAAGEEVSAINAAVEMNKLLQISSGAVYSDTGEVVEFDCANRLNELVDIINQSSHKTLVFANFTHSIDVIQRHLTKHGINNGAIYGDVKLRKRSQLIDDFQKTNNLQVLVIQPQAASHGITLHAANTVVWFGPIPSLEYYLQANARVHRAGQKNPCTVVHLMGSGVEKQMYRRLQNKKGDQESLLAMYKKVIGIS